MNNTRNLPINIQRFWQDFMDMAQITEPDRPWTRRSFTSRFLEGRNWLVSRMEAAGLNVRLDAAGNLIGRREGKLSNGASIVIGSHSDTVLEGGRFDGIAGVLAGLEVARALLDQKIELDHPLEIIDCLAEEVSAYGPSCIGSRAIAGCLDGSMLARVDQKGETLGQAIERMGGNLKSLATAQRNDIAAYLELHIEQGQILETEQCDIGIVTALVGICRVEILIKGRADHAGATSMDRRADALVAGSTLTLVIREIALRLSGVRQGHFAATVGEFRIEPNAANVVPSKCTLLVDIRYENSEQLLEFQNALTGKIVEVQKQFGVNISAPCILSNNPPTRCNRVVMRTLETVCGQMAISHRRMASGAGHDMAWFARITPAAMIFVASKEGRSHCPEEWSEPEALALGAAVLYEALLSLDKTLPASGQIER